MYFNTYFANKFDLVSLPTGPLKKIPAANNGRWQVLGDEQGDGGKAAMSVPPGRMSHEDSTEES